MPDASLREIYLLRRIIQLGFALLPICVIRATSPELYKTTWPHLVALVSFAPVTRQASHLADVEGN